MSAVAENASVHVHEFVEVDDCSAEFDQAAFGEQPHAGGRFGGVWGALQGDFEGALHLSCRVFSGLAFDARGKRVRRFRGQRVIEQRERLWSDGGDGCRAQDVELSGKSNDSSSGTRVLRFCTRNRLRQN